MVQENNPSTMSKDELVKLLRGNIKAFNQLREGNGFESIDMTDAKLQGATLTGAKLQGIDFSGANFEYANLVSADLSGAILRNALLIYGNLTSVVAQEADFEGADLTGAQLEGANLNGANLSMALFSQANLTNVSLDQTDLESTNFCSANLSNTNFKNALNVKYCIFDKFTRWPHEKYLPQDFNPGKGMYGSDEDFSTEIQEVDHSSMHDAQPHETMSAEELKFKLMDDVQITGKGLPEIEKKQILLDRKLDYVIASMKVIQEKMITMSEKGVGAGPEGEYADYDGYEGAVGGVNAKLQELDDKIENIAGILTRFPVKSLEETYKLTDVINRIEETQGDIHGKLTQSVMEVAKANEEIQSILGGKLRASYISGLDKMFIESVNAIKDTILKSQDQIIKESSQLDFNFEDTSIITALEAQVNQSSQVIRQDLERKLGTHGLFLKQMDEKLEKMRERTDFTAILGKLRDDFDYKINQVVEITEGLEQSHREQINNLILKLKTIDQKIDIMSETSTLSSVSNLIAEFGAGFSTELQQVKEAAIAIENRLKGLTGEVDLSTDFAIEAIAKSINTGLKDSIAEAIINAQLPEGGMDELVETVSHKLDLLGKVLDAKTSHIESRVHEAVKDASAQALSSSDLSIAEDLKDLRTISESLASQIDELKNLGPEGAQIESVKEDLVRQIEEIMSRTKEIPEDAMESEDIQAKAANLHDMSAKIAEKLDTLYSNFDERSDVLEEKVDEIAQSELEDLMSEFSQELEDLRNTVGDLDSNTRETIKIQGISSQEVINGLREDLTASVDEVLRSIREMEEEGGLPAGDGGKLSDIKKDISEKAELLKHLTDRISGKMENLFENISKKTSQLEQKVDILAQAETDSTDIMNDLLAEFETDLNDELKSLRDMLGHIEGRLNDPSFNELTTEILTKTIMEKLQEKMEVAVDKTNDALVKKITGALSPEEEHKVFREEDYDDSMQGDITFIKDVVNEIHEKLPKYSMDTVEKIEHVSDSIHEKLEVLEMAVMTKTGDIHSIMQDIVKEASSLPAAEKTFDISNDIENLKSIASSLDQQLKEIDISEKPASEMSLKEMREQIDFIEKNSHMLADEFGLEDVDNKVGNLKDISVQIAEKMEHLAGQIGDNIDIGEQLSSAAEDEVAELLDEFSAELEEVREFIQSTSTMTRDSIKAQSMMNEESINRLREDITSSLDRMTSAIGSAEEGSIPFAQLTQAMAGDGVAYQQSQMQEVSNTISSKLEGLLETIQKKTQTLESKVDILAQSGGEIDIIGDMLAELRDDLIKELSGKVGVDTKNVSAMAHDISGELESLKTIASSLDDQFKAIDLAATTPGGMTLEEMRDQIDYVEKNIQLLAEEVGLEDVGAKVNTLKDISDQVAKKVEQLAKQIGDNIDVTDQLSVATEAEMADLLEEFSAELEEVRDFIQSTSTLTRDSIKAQSMMNEESVNRIREDITSSLDRMTSAIGDATPGSIPFAQLADDILDPDIAFKQSQMREVSEKISEKIDSLRQTIQSETQTLEQKVDILAQSDKDESEVINELLVELKEDLLNELSGLLGDSTKDFNDLADEIHSKVSSIQGILEASPTQLGEVIKGAFEEVNLGEIIKQAMVESSGGSYEAVITKEISEMHEKINSIHGNIEASAPDNIGEIVKDAIEEVKIAEVIRETVESSSQDTPMAREISEINEKLTSMEEVLSAASQKEVIELVTDIESNISEKIASLKEITEDVNDTLAKLDELATENITAKLDDLIDNGITVDSEVLIDNIRVHLEQKMSELNIEEVIQGSVSDLTHKIEKLYEDVMDLNIALESKIDELTEKDPSEDLLNIRENLGDLKELNDDLSTKLDQLSGDLSVDAVTDMITDIETSIAREVEFLRTIGETINQGFTELEATIDTRKIENNLDELIEFNGEVAAKLDKVLDATGNIDSEALLTRIKDHLEDKITDLLDQDVGLEQILENLGSDLTEKLTHVLDHNQEIDTKLDKIIESDRAKQLENIMGEVHTLKTTAFDLDEKLDQLIKDTQALNIEDQIMELQRDIKSKVELIADVVNAESIISSIEEFHNGLMERTATLQEKVESIASDDLAEGIDGITTDISLLRNLTEDITEKVERIISNTENLQTEEGMQTFRQGLEDKLNAIIESDPTLNMENILTSIGNSLSSKIDDYSNTTRSYISDVLSTIEENIIAATTEKDISISDFVDEAENKVRSLQDSIKDMTARLEALQEISENTLLAKSDVEDLYSNIDAVTVSLNEKTDSILDNVSKQLDASGLSSVKTMRRELEKRLDALSETTTNIRERLELDFEGIVTENIGLIGQNVLKGLEQLSTQLSEETSRIDEKVSAFQAEDIITQIDGLVSDVLVELDKEVNRIGKLTANIDKNIVTMDKNVKVVDKTTLEVEGKVDTVSANIDDRFENIEGELKRLPAAILREDPKKSSQDGAIEALVQFMQKDADQKLLLMKELIHTTAARGPGGELETRLKNLESHIANEAKRHEDKLKNVMGSMKNLLEDIEGLKTFTPMPGSNE